MLCDRHDEFGPPEVLRAEELPHPDPGPGQARIAVAAAGVHLLDTFLRAGRHRRAGARAHAAAIPARGGRGRSDAVGKGTARPGSGSALEPRTSALAGAGYATLAVVGEEARPPVPTGSRPRPPSRCSARAARRSPSSSSPSPARATSCSSSPQRAASGTLLVQLGKEADAVVVGAAGGPEKVAFVAGSVADVAVDYDAPGWDGTACARRSAAATSTWSSTASAGEGPRRGGAPRRRRHAHPARVVGGHAEPSSPRRTDPFVRSLDVIRRRSPEVGRDPQRMRAYARTALELGAGGRLVPAPA